MPTTRFHPSRRGATPSVAEQMRSRARKVEAKGEKVIYLQVGQPSTGAPAGAIDAIHRASDTSILGYTSAAGIPELRARISKNYQDQYGVTVDPERIVITFGASGAMILALIGCFDAGARIALPQPFYYGYRHAMGTLGVECVPFDTSMESHFQPTVDDIEQIEGEIDGLIFASPGNPTGSMMPREQMQELSDYCQRKEIRLISDEIYHGIVFDDEVPQQTATAFSDEIIVVNSFSKYYSMAGWRLGWMVLPEYLVEPISNLAHNLYLCPPAPSQYGALHAMDCREELDGHVDRYKKNRDILLAKMPEMGFDRYSAPHGAFYLYCHVKHLHEDSLQFAIEMLEGCGVLAAPGSDFSVRHGHHYIRFSYAGSTADVEEAVARMTKWRNR
ncbi:MAG: aminotransferase class I/II-fold pyridoxal phosphate-dependent enzyme [Planctomycetota bacterium]|nr:aminotransferase class I/II-fold pyridoxal phosphate-dependent enzyme [Planctomycetota bacterium]